MKNNHKIMFFSSIILNIILVIVVLIGYININLENENIFIFQVQDKLIRLEGLIDYQEENDWEDSEIVAVKMREIVNGLEMGLMNGKNLHVLNEEESEILESLADKLNKFTFDKPYELVNLTDEHKEYYAALRDSLNEAGLKMNSQISKDWETFFHQAKKLEESIDVPSDIRYSN
ncbi:hypothetical protein [Tenuibacillus multivorans]|uniref:Uncharacterized protein n=1 Tax=Tenuibacillus multivorans TaxID=237069 RepID=A0A1G9Y8A7_9BACI|nr:hypothetical protein [Tenuibacillus multivorans]GEL75988.1 hypothetical protein TMU01_02230 [Tenuibacillus multivorans]SDN05324.1 hypothetical protein SAMN05216498_1283 [Tenuibacillus multivorans]